MSTKDKLIKMSSNEAYLKFGYINAIETPDKAHWNTLSLDNLKFSDGGENQWTTEELATLKERGNYTAVIDFTKKAIDSIVGVFTANKPDLRAVCNKGLESPSAKIRTLMLKQTWKDSDGLLRLREILTNAYKANISYAFVSPFKGRMTFRMLTFNQVSVDPRSVDPMFRDAEWIVVKKWIPVERVMATYGVQSIATSYPTEWATSDYTASVPVLQLYDPTTRSIQIFECYKKIPVRLPNGLIKNRIVREVLIGFEHMYKDILPDSITEYPIVPVYSNYSCNTLKTSFMNDMREKQRLINKMYNITVMNAQSTGSPKIFVNVNDIPNEDIETLANNYAIPGSLNALNPGAQAPVVVQAQPINNAFFTLYQDASQYFFRIYSAMGLDGSAGDSSAQDNGVSLYEKREAVMDSLKTAAGIYEAFLKQLGVCILQGWSAYVSSDQIVLATGANEVIKQVEQDLQNGIDVNNPENMQKFQDAMQKKGIQPSQIEEIMIEAKERSDFVDAVFDTLNNIGDLEFDVNVVPDSYAPSYQAGKFNIAMQLAQGGVVDQETLLELSPLDDKSKIIRRVSIAKQLQGQNEQMSVELEKITKELEAKDKQIQDMMNALTQAKNEGRFDKLYGDQRAKSYVHKQMLGADRTEKNRQLDYQIKELMLELKENKEELKNLTYDDVRNAITII